MYIIKDSSYGYYGGPHPKYGDMISFGGIGGARKYEQYEEAIKIAKLYNTRGYDMSVEEIKGGEKMADEWILIQVEYESMERMSCVPTNIHKVKADHVFDEDKSVKWNREQVEDNNSRYLEEVKRLNTEKNHRRDELHERIYKVIQDEVGYGLSRRKAMLLWNRAYEDGHGCGIREIISNLDDLMELAIQLLKPEV